MSNGKIINDPVFGFIKIPGGVLMDIVDHPLMQRLRHIKQLGLASIVYPGAQHTRFQHSLGAYWLMNEAVMTLAQKGIFIFDSEAVAIKAAILMHDIGHGPYSLASTWRSISSRTNIPRDSCTNSSAVNSTWTGSIICDVIVFSRA